MSEELARSQAQLKLGEHAPPYFLSYQVKDLDQRLVVGRYGALFQSDASRERRIFADVRVGSYELDNSLRENLELAFEMEGRSYVPSKEAPLEDDALALRTALWLITDERYKAALFDFLKRKGQGVYELEDPDRPPSFSRETPVRWIQEPMDFRFDQARWEREARELGARFLQHPQLFDSEIRITADREQRFFVSSEGSRLLTESVIYGVHISAVARADDGQLLDMSRDFYAPSEAQLPGPEELRKAQDAVIQELLALREAPAIDPYTGPAILAPEAAGVLFHETLGHRLEGERQGNDGEGKTFRGQVGRRVLPTFLTVTDDPTLAQVAGKPLNGHYRYDEQGVPGQRTVLVRKGVLERYLLSRAPVQGFLKSNGHGRSQGNLRPVARMANLIIDSSRSVDDGELKRRLIAEARRQGKQYGLLIRDITGGNTNTSNYGYQAFKGVPRMVYRVDVDTGKETLVRGVEIVGTPLSSINRILATGRKQGVFNGFCGAESGMVPVSTVAPAVLLQEIELQRSIEGKDRPPLMASPATGPAPTLPAVGREHPGTPSEKSPPGAPPPGTPRPPTPSKPPTR